MTRSQQDQKTPVIILSGFLGSGKTTLLNRILTAPHGRRIAVIMNEFGEVGIDHHLLIASDQQILRMNNGCICCTVRGDLLQNFFHLLELRSQFDTVIIETTGLAEPAPVAQSLYADEQIRRAFTLDGVVAVVDAKHVLGQLRDSGEAAEQIAFADLILVNKTDLVTPEELENVEGEIGRINNIARLLQTRNSEIDLAEIFDLGKQELASNFKAASHHDHDCHDHESCDHPDHHHGHHHGHHHKHLQGIETISIVEPGPLDGLRMSSWFRSLIADFGADLMRMKGVLNMWGDPDQFLFQGVQMEFEGKPGRPWLHDEERLNRLVFIGRRLDREKIVEGFRTCIVVDNEQSTKLSDPFGRDNLEVSSHALDQIRYWMRQNFGFPAGAPIVIKEVPCVKPSCPPIETAIVAILQNEPPRLFKVQRPINEITFDHVYDLMENPMPCC